MTELRWLKMKNWKYGKVKLQYGNDIPLAQGGTAQTDWLDVPMVDPSDEHDFHNCLNWKDCEKCNGQVVSSSECCKPKEDSTVDKWCLHMSELVAKDADTHWKFCPICSAPRPLSKSLREVLAENLKNKCYELRPVGSFAGWFCDGLADTAIETIKQFESKEGVK